jgi:phosphopantothenoylcysteine decarboxylase/phosphopantothenate--cysteine ligase
MRKNNKMTDNSKFCVVLGITGSIAAYKTAELVRGLRALRDQRNPGRRVIVRPVLTESGAKFVTPETLQTVAGGKVYTNLFSDPGEWDVEHIGLSDDADLLLIAPATANFMAKMAHGIADDLLTSVTLACTCPVMLAPAMNVNMWENVATRENEEILRQRGVKFIGPDSGELACGYSGKGRMSAVSEIIAKVESLFLTRYMDLNDKKIIVTAGPTREYIDPVRFISNPSTGKMGYAIAIEAAKRGANVTLISGPVDLPTPDGMQLIKINTTAEMNEAVNIAASRADIIIGAAAPADFAPVESAEQKIKKSGKKTENLELVATPDILANLGKIKRNDQVIVAFAAETENLLQHASDKIKKKNADFIVANDVTAAGCGFAVDTNKATLIYADGEINELELMTKAALANIILDAALIISDKKSAR